MLIPDNIHPQQTVYYNGSFVLKSLQSKQEMDFLELYITVISECDMSMPVFVLCLDWLFLLNLIAFNDQGKVTLCS